MPYPITSAVADAAIETSETAPLPPSFIPVASASSAPWLAGSYSVNKPTVIESGTQARRQYKRGGFSETALVVFTSFYLQSILP